MVGPSILGEDTPVGLPDGRLVEIPPIGREFRLRGRLVRVLYHVVGEGCLPSIASIPELESWSGIPQAWLVDLGAERAVTHREPAGDAYRRVRTVGRGEEIVPLDFPHVTLAVDEILG